jgi:hypothetical protein
MAKKQTASIYSVHPGIAKVPEWVARLPEKTGRSLDEWVAFVKRSGPPATKERREWLKQEHQLGTNWAAWIVDLAEGRGEEKASAEAYLKAAEGYVEAMFGRGKSGLRPIYEALLALGISMGKDVKACPCQTIVPLYRNHAQIKPTTRTRIDFGLALGDTKAMGKLIDTGGFAKKDRVTHRFAIADLKDIDPDVRRWLKTAYERDG